MASTLDTAIPNCFLTLSHCGKQRQGRHNKSLTPSANHPSKLFRELKYLRDWIDVVQLGWRAQRAVNGYSGVTTC